MVTSHRYLAAGLMVLGLSVSAPACASTGYYYPAGRDYRDFERHAYDNGFREGVKNGEHDARDREDYRVDRDSDYREADEGYHRGDGLGRDQYRRVFRRGYEAGYAEGYNRIARRSGGYGGYGGRDGYGDPRRATPGIVIQPPYGSPRGGYGYQSPAAQNGYRDGLEAGRNDAREGERFDPIRPKRYREGDHDYDNRYGPRDEYRRDYRAAFQQGYEQGYREYRR
jgi:hypothetical protein